MNKKAILLTTLTTSILISSLLVATIAPKAVARDSAWYSQKEIPFTVPENAIPKQVDGFSVPSVAMPLRKETRTVESGDLQLGELLTIGGLALAASVVVGFRRDRQQKKAKGT